MTLRPAVSGLRPGALSRSTLYGVLAASTVVVAVAILSWFARGNVVLGPSSAALGQVQTGLGNQVTSVTVEDGSHPVPAFVQNGQIWPKQAIRPGAAVFIQVDTRAWLWNPWVATAEASYRLVAPRSPSVLHRHLRVALGHAPVVKLSGLSQGLSVRSSAAVSWAVLKTTAGRFALAQAAANPGEHVTALVRTRARAWEAWSQPQLLEWTTPPYLAARSSWSLNGVSPVLLVHFSAPVAKLPPGTITLTPTVAGTWEKLNSLTWEFQPAPDATLYPGESVTMRIVGGRQGVAAVTGTYLASSLRLQTSLPLGKVLRAQELLASLGYLPLSWSGPSASGGTTQLA
ncbi:MAG: hypothetical protein ACP5QO_16855, partial [Clostridia bacterium]